MTNSEAIMLMQAALIVATKISAPVLLISMGVGLIISIFQAATQIHEQTITFVPKLILIAVIMLLTGGVMLEEMQDFFKYIFELMLK
ncbi:MAG: flagellar biosynthesis protein FliQ [Proteocatella sp.]